jgi:hypothetical protein
MIRDIKNIMQHRCYYRSLFLYNICYLIDRGATYRINIMMHCSKKAWGHAWLTRNGKTFLIPNKHVLPFILEKIGENNRYTFWITQ